MKIYSPIFALLTVCSLYHGVQASQTAEEVRSRKRKGMQDTAQLDAKLLDAVKTNNVPATARLLREGANPDVKDEIGHPILVYAVKNIPILSLLLNHQADVNIQDGDGYTPLSIATGANTNLRPYIDALTLLLDKSADINLPSNKGYTPLMLAINSNTEDIALQIINMFFDAPQTLDINAQEKQGSTALMVAAAKGYAKIAHLLLEKGANWKLAHKSGKTAEDLARALGKTEVVTTIEDFKKLQESGHREALRSIAQQVLQGQWHIPGPKPAPGGLKGTAQVISIPVASFLRPKAQQATRPPEVNVEEEK